MTSSPVSDAPIDSATLDQLAHDIGPEPLREALSLFLAELTECERQLTQTGQSINADQLARISHMIKSSAGTFGASRLRQTAAEIEHLTAGGITPDSESLNAMVTQMAQVRIALNTRITSSGNPGRD